jgi:predicted amidohydrolase YtcJ
MATVSRRAFILGGVSLSTAALAKWQMEPEVIVHNAAVWTAGRTSPQIEALAIGGGRILATGSNSEILALATPRTRKFDLGGRRVTPGFYDAHSHPVLSGIQQLYEVAVDKTSIAAIQAAIRERAQRTPNGQWVLGYLYDDGKTPRPINRSDLDQAAPDHPVLIRHRGGHTIFVNSLAYQRAGVTENTPDPEHGRYFRDSSGRLDGRVGEDGLARFEESARYTPTRTDYRMAGALIAKIYASKGITSACDAHGTAACLQGYQDAHDAGELVTRIYMHIGNAEIDKLMTAGVHTGLGNEWVRVGALKLFADGSISERTAWLSQPYVGGGDYRGLEAMSRDALYERARLAHRAGWQIGIHANGDVAIDRVLGVFEQLQAEAHRRDPRFRIEHCTLVNPALIDRMKRVGAIPIPFAAYVGFHGSIMHFYGAERLQHMFAMRDFIDAGLRPPSASDYTASPIEPMLWLRSQVTRTDADNRVWGVNQRITMSEALQCATINGAYASFDETDRGSIEPGKLADLTVWDRDILDTEPAELMSVRAERTMVHGRWVYEA